MSRVSRAKSFRRRLFMLSYAESLFKRRTSDIIECMWTVRPTLCEEENCGREREERKMTLTAQP